MQHEKRELDTQAGLGCCEASDELAWRWLPQAAAQLLSLLALWLAAEGTTEPIA